MKNFILRTFIFCISINIIFAQNNNDNLSKICLSVVMPENVDGLDASQLSKLESKIIQITTSNGLSSTGYDNSFVIYPKFAIYDVNVADGGMQTITVANCEIDLFIKQVSTNTIFSSFSKVLKGSGNSKSSAITNAIYLIPVNEASINKFISDAKTKIIDYYNQNCQNILTKADNLEKIHDYAQAMALLISIPQESAECYSLSQAKIISDYKLYQNAECEKNLQKANADLAASNYYQSIQDLLMIDPESKCYDEAKKLMNSNASKITAEQKQQYDLEIKRINDANELEKLRIDAIKAIAAAYYSSQPKSVEYINIIK